VRDGGAFLLLASVARQTIFLRPRNGLRCDDIASGRAAVGATAIPYQRVKVGSHDSEGGALFNSGHKSDFIAKTIDNSQHWRG
jgi:hypothetical protein